MQNILLFIQHHIALSVAFVAILVVLIILEFIKIRRGTNRLSPAQAVRMINHENAVIVDVRAYDAFLTGHIVDAISLPLAEMPTKLKKIEKFKTKPLILVCGTGVESQQAATTLLKNGFNPTILGGGIRAWRDAEMPLVKG